MISHEYKFIYIHPPKTGGSSIEESLQHLCEFDHPKHQYMCDIHYHFDNRKGNKKRFDEYFKFCTVRNPWKRMFSLYKFYNRKREWTKESFRKFISSRFNGDKGPDVQTVIDFCSIVESPEKGCKDFKTTLSQDNKLAIDFFIRLENFQEDFDYVCEKIGVEKRKVPHSYKTKRANYKDFYDEDLTTIVGDKFKKDIDFFNYSF